MYILVSLANLCPGLQGFFSLASCFFLLPSPVSYPSFAEYQAVLYSRKRNLFYPILFPHTSLIFSAKH